MVSESFCNTSAFFAFFCIDLSRLSRSESDEEYVEESSADEELELDDDPLSLSLS
ncbi:unnamed protein product [Schistosoma mattheei]|uniref:Secreted protein n=2 Tax=Schistosoma TaxID=6181 RepID=A0A183KTM9_9TREM|nr:unnamed protein product [Schistosoma mattheei]VDP65755.1 unnamed protein product [Schistosoma curassoni]